MDTPLFEAETPLDTDNIALVVAKARETFGDDRKAAKWLSRENRNLGASPLECAFTEEGARKVLTMLGRIDHGIGA